VEGEGESSAGAHGAPTANGESSSASMSKGLAISHSQKEITFVWFIITS
jgi:hypothetical protein